MNLVKELIKKRVEKIGTKPAKEAAKIFRQHKTCLEEIICEASPKPTLDSMISVVINHQYANLPPPSEVEYWYQHSYDMAPELAVKLRESYWSFQRYLFELNRTDISDKKKLKYFAKIPKLYNTCMAALSKMAKSEEEKTSDQHYDIT